jgi:peroxiredoxin Q/BCP
MSSENISLPNQTFPTTQGEINLADVSAEWLILYFYPKDSTPGCTTQAVGFSCLKDQFDAWVQQLLVYHVTQSKHIKILLKNRH